MNKKLTFGFILMCVAFALITVTSIFSHDGYSYIPVPGFIGVLISVLFFRNLAGVRYAKRIQAKSDELINKISAEPDMEAPKSCSFAIAQKGTYSVYLNGALAATVQGGAVKTPGLGGGAFGTAHLTLTKRSNLISVLKDSGENAGTLYFTVADAVSGVRGITLTSENVFVFDKKMICKQDVKN